MTPVHAGSIVAHLVRPRQSSLIIFRGGPRSPLSFLQSFFPPTLTVKEFVHVVALSKHTGQDRKFWEVIFVVRFSQWPYLKSIGYIAIAAVVFLFFVAFVVVDSVLVVVVIAAASVDRRKITDFFSRFEENNIVFRRTILDCFVIYQPK